MSNFFNTEPPPSISLKTAISKMWGSLPLPVRSLCAVVSGYAALVYAAVPLFKCAVMQTNDEVPILEFPRFYHSLMVLLPLLIWIPYIRSIKKMYLMAAPQAQPFKIAAIIGIILSILFAVAYMGVGVPA